MNCTLVRPLRSGAKKCWLKDDDHYLYKRNGDYKAGTICVCVFWLHLTLNIIIYFLQATRCILSAASSIKPVAAPEWIIGIFFKDNVPKFIIVIIN